MDINGFATNKVAPGEPPLTGAPAFCVQCGDSCTGAGAICAGCAEIESALREENKWLRNALECIAGSCEEVRAVKLARAGLKGPNVELRRLRGFSRRSPRTQG